MMNNNFTFLLELVSSLWLLILMYIIASKAKVDSKCHFQRLFDVRQVSAQIE